MRPIELTAVQAVHDQRSFLRFLGEEMGWPMQENLSFDDLTFGWSPEDIGLKAEDLRGSTYSQLRPFVNNQPWGIFIVHLKSPKIYLTELRRVLRAFAPKHRKLHDHPTWNPQHLLFICTPDWKNFTFCHFDGADPARSRLSTFGWDYQSSYLRTLCEFNLTALEMPEPDLIGVSPTTWLDQWSKAFDLKQVTDTFFEEMKEVYAKIQNHITGMRGDRKASFAQLLINRLLFLKFLERKGWLFVNENDSLEDRKLYLRRQREKLGQQNQWQCFFYHLFFRGLNRQSVAGIRELTPAVTQLIGFVPFLNGGLFEQSKEWKDTDVKVDNRVFDEIFGRLLDRYNFTIQENTPLDVEVALNPDLLGYAYEELIAERHGQGAFYTHPTEVGLMCRESLKTFLQEHTSIGNISIAQLIGEWDASGLSEDEAFQVYKLLLEMKILDPAVGSGAYPVRMMQELVNVHKALADRMTEGHLKYICENKLADPRSVFDLKLNIVQDNLYGVDIDFFAVEIAKLRFWLSLVVDFDKPVNTPAQLDSIPALPNLDFKLRVGDSLVATPGRVKVKRKGKTENVILNLDTHFSEHGNMDAFFYSKTVELRALKEIFFNFEELRKKDDKYLAISKDELRAKIAQMELDIAKDIGFPVEGSVEECRHILWQIHFAEIFSDERFGFDVCIANPPYLRQEKLKEIFERFDMDITKDDLVDSYETLYKHQDLKIDKKSDLYVYFYLRGINLLKEKGVLCFICSNSWLDVGYGAKLQEFLLRNSRVKAVFDNSAQRSFEKADVNTTINVFIKDHSVEGRRKVEGVKKQEVTVESNNTVRFVTFRRSFELAAGENTLRAIETATKIASTEDYSVYPITQKELWTAGLGSDAESDSADYTGDKWGGEYLRAPQIFFEILNKKPELVDTLSRYFEGERYLNTGGADGFFIVTDVDEADDKSFTVRNGAFEGKVEREYLKPLVKDLTKNDKRIEIKTYDAHCVVIRGELKRGIRKYVEWGERERYHQRSVTKNQKPWYKATNQMITGARVLIPRSFADSFVAYYNPSEYLSLRFYRLHKKEGDELQLIAFLNSSLVCLFQETLGNKNLGLGGMDFYMADFLKMKIPIVLTEKLNEPIKKMRARSIGSIWKEFQLNPSIPLRAQKPEPLPDRKALDDAIFDRLGLTQVERKEVYWSISELVQNRFKKALSV